MSHRLIMRTLLAAILVVGSLTAQAATGVSTGRRNMDVSIRTFMDETMAIVNTFREKTTSFTANVTMVRRVPGLTRFVSSDCRMVYRAPDSISINVKGISPYIVQVSNKTVTITFLETQEVDVRPLGEKEEGLADFLGIAGPPPKKTYDFTFKIEKNLYVVESAMRPDVRRRLSQDLFRNARTAIKRVMWINPRTEQIVKTHVVTLGGDDTVYTFREQWINTAESRQ